MPTVVDMMGKAYPELTQRVDFVSDVIKSEEKRFDQTLKQGLEKFAGYVDAAEKAGKKKLSGEDVFTLYNKYSFEDEYNQEKFKDE